MLDPPTNQNHKHSVRKRNRVPVSCIPCRAKRSKCDRGRPCSRCAEIGHPDLCKYFDKPARYERQSVSSTEYEPKDDGSHSESQYSTTRSDYERSTGLSHSQWHSVLDDIGHVSPELASKHETQSTQGKSSVSLLLSQTPMPFDDVLTTFLPPREKSDRFLSKYFTAQYGTLPILHKNQYAKEYLAFWSLPHSKVSPLWLSTLFSTFAQALVVFPDSSENSAQLQHRFHFAAVQCLIHGGYDRPKPWLLEALLMHVMVCYLSQPDPPREIILLTPIVARLAYESGIHREPGSNVSPFVGEMQRRLFVLLKHFDVVLSYQTGVPTVLAPDICDIQEPHNLYDDDFDEEVEVLPPSRPETDAGQILSFIVKDRLLNVFYKIYRTALAIQPPNEAELDALDLEARNEYARIPKPFKIRPLSESFIDSQMLIMTRLNCEFLAQRSFCVLHRKAMVAGNLTSTHKCVNASIAIVECFVDIHKEMQPGGQVHGYGRMISSTMINDFFLASMIFCLAISLDARSHNAGRQQMFSQMELERFNNLLQESHRISMSIKDMSAGARKVAQAIAAALTKKTPTSIPLPDMMASAYSEPSTDGPGFAPTTPLDPTLDTSTQLIGIVDMASPYETAWANPDFEAMLNDPTGIDWSSLDQFLNYPSR